MARTSTVLPQVSRNSRDADRPRPASQSPFRSAKVGRRIAEARKMIEKREKEIAQLEKALDNAGTPKARKMLSQRLLATRNNLRSWEDYMSGHNEEDEACYREHRAVISH